MKKSILCFLLTLTSCSIAQNSTTYAVVIGIADYQISGYKTGDLAFADQDANRMVDFLQSKAGGYVPSSQIIKLQNAAATKKEIIKAMTIYKKAKATDKIIFYFSGHGMNGAFLPYDVQKNSFISTLSHSEIKASFKKSIAKTKLCIADACMAGSMKIEKQSTKNFGAFPANTNIAMILSSRSTQVSVENRLIEGGIFTYFLLHGLNGYADKNNDKTVTIKELYQFVGKNVKKNTLNAQAPVFAGKFADNLILSNVK